MAHRFPPNHAEGATQGEDPYADWDAAYLLGALAADERIRYERQLSRCPQRARGLAALAALPALLRTLDITDVRDAIGDRAATSAASSDDAAVEPPTPTTRNAVTRAAFQMTQRSRRFEGTIARPSPEDGRELPDGP